jgi:predicted O-methyltransferase YrrM
MGHFEHYTADWFSHNVENWSRWLIEFRGKPAVRALEVGSWEGRSAVWLLKHILTGDGASLDCVDYGHRADVFAANTAPWSDRVTMHRGGSYWILPQLKGEYDLIYLDGAHEPYGAMRDAALAWPKLKVGGLLIFDDYLFLHETVDPNRGRAQWSQKAALEAISKHPEMATKTGIDGFLQAIVGQHETVEQAYQLAVRKTKPTLSWADG